MKKGMKRRRLQFTVGERVRCAGLKNVTILKVLEHTWSGYTTKYLIRCKHNDLIAKSRSGDGDKRWYKFPMRERFMTKFDKE
jgi:hypothetical protein